MQAEKRLAGDSFARRLIASSPVRKSFILTILLGFWTSGTARFATRYPDGRDVCADVIDRYLVLRAGFNGSDCSRRQGRDFRTWPRSCGMAGLGSARAALPYVAEKDTALGRWAKSLLSRVHQNVAVVAFANKLARICWAVLRSGQKFGVQEAPLTTSGCENG